MISLSKPVIGKKELRSAIEVMKSGFLTQGSKVRELEEKMAELTGAKYAIAVNSGTAALHTALYSIGIKRGDEIITTPFTFIASVNSILMLGATPVFVDIDPATYNINPLKIEAVISRKTKAILAVNLFGQTADFGKINKVAKAHHLAVVEDAAQSIGAKYQKGVSGNLADISCFSFYATKNIMCAEGGMITTNNYDYYRRGVCFRNHGQEPDRKYEYSDIGYNYRMTDILASIALAQLEKIGHTTEKRREIARKYTQKLTQLEGLITPYESHGNYHTYHQYTIRVTNDCKRSRDKLKDYLFQKGIQTGIYYPKPLHLIPHVRKAMKRNYFLPVSEMASRHVISIPIHPGLTMKETDYVINSITNI